MRKSTPNRPKGKRKRPPLCGSCGARTVGTRKPACPNCTCYELGRYTRPIPYELTDRRPEGGAR